MTDGTKAVVWNAVWTPWGSPQSITGSATLNARFPGQWFQVEAGLHYNWHRHYDPTLGRYTQPDPLGFVDGPSVYAYAGSSPMLFIDRDGLQSTRCPPGQRPTGHPSYPSNPEIYTCEPNPSEPPRPGCSGGDCITFPPDTNTGCACYDDCKRDLRLISILCRSGGVGGSLGCAAALTAACKAKCINSCKKPISFVPSTPPEQCKK